MIDPPRYDLRAYRLDWSTFPVGSRKAVVSFDDDGPIAADLLISHSD